MFYFARPVRLERSLCLRLTEHYFEVRLLTYVDLCDLCFKVQKLQIRLL